MTQRRTTVRIATAVTAVGALFALAGCAGPQGATELDPEADVTLTWWTGQSDEAETLLEGMAAEFEELHPNVTIDISSGASSTEELLQKLSAGFAGNSYPNISYSFGAWASELESSQRTLDITDQVADPEVGWDEFSEAARATVQPTGEAIIGFPALVDNISLIYNKTVFDAAGVDYPTEEWTWDDFRDAAKKLTDASTETYGYAYSVSGSEETTWQFWPHLWQHGGDILADDGTAAFASDEGVEALEFLRQMAVEDQSVYLDQTDTKFAQLFAADRIGMMTSGPWQLWDLGTAGTDYGVTILPGIDGDHQTVSGPDIWALFDTQDANENHWSFELMKWLTAPEQDLRWNVAYGNLPLRTSEIDTPEFQEQVKALPGLDVMAENNANAVNARPTVAGYVGLSEAIGSAISQVLQGQGTPEEALKAAAEKADRSLAD
ncbi:extracellular solute-binding protein [Microbacterium aerolatum]|uniref:ABC transporter substrate-binding protein n=1 Tax=Microbacterium aerolatum TaxID=153731 RepID=A0A511AJ09_9MICO|nr:extracellular solute-binding protein [Microbacterium aerolatum]GEK87942.1 ABC transporter substrate-binding protein [Microbacterium aerolatum]GGB32170.1 ABC transporter substrate-binding protein [Microbacterium aerolatum]